jgi:nucleosome binding factor SPN SPT16 subunit
MLPYVQEATKMMDISDTVEKSVAKIAAQCDPKLDPDGIQVMIPPLIQSGGKYDLKWNAQV